MEGAVAEESGRIVHQPAQVELVEQPLLGAVDELGEVGQVLESADRVGHVAFGEPDLVGGAEGDVAELRQRLLSVGFDFRSVAQQPVAVERRAAGPRARIDRRARDDAVEVGRPVAVAGRQPVRIELEGPAWCAARGQVAGHHERPLHLAGDVRVLRRCEVLDACDAERGGMSLHDPIGEVGVAELREGVVADVEHAAGDVLVAGDSEVPGEVEVASLDVRLAQRMEYGLEVSAAPVDHR